MLDHARSRFTEPWNTATADPASTPAIASGNQEHPEPEPLERKVDAEEIEQKARQNVDGDLGRSPGEERRHARRRVRIGRRQPGVQGKDRGFQSDAEHHEHHPRGHGPSVGHVADPNREIRHVQGTGHHVEQPDADEEERRPDRAEDEIPERGEQRGGAGAEGDQGVGRQRGDLEEDEHVEHVAGDRDAEYAGQAQQPRGVEESDPLAADLARDAEPRMHERHGARAAHDHYDQRVQRIDAVLDAPGRRPASEQVGDLRPVRHRHREGDRDREAHRADRGRETPRDGGTAQHRAHRRRQEWDDDLQGGKLRLQGAHAVVSSTTLGPFRIENPRCAVRGVSFRAAKNRERLPESRFRGNPQRRAPAAPTRPEALRRKDGAHGYLVCGAAAPSGLLPVPPRQASTGPVAWSARSTTSSSTLSQAA